MSNLGITQVAASQTQKEVVINAADARIEAALTETFDADVAAGDVTVTADQYQTALEIRAINATIAGRTVTLPAVKRIMLLSNDAGSTASVDFMRGTTAVTAAPGVSAVVRTDGTVNGLVVLLRGSAAGAITSADIADFNSAVDARIGTRAVTLRIAFAGKVDAERERFRLGEAAYFFDASNTNHSVTCDKPPLLSTTYTATIAGVTVTATIAAGQNEGTVTLSGDITTGAKELVVGDGPATADEDAELISITLAGERI